MSKSLKTIQIVSKVAKVIATVVYVCCIIGAVACLLAFVALLGVQGGLKIDGDNVSEIIMKELDINIATISFACFAGFLACLSECILSKFAIRYLKNELQAGTPFTYDGSKEVLRLGILTITIPVALSIVLGIAFIIFKIIYPEAQNMIGDSSISLELGLVILLASVIFKYGAELEEKKSGSNSQEN